MRLLLSFILLYLTGSLVGQERLYTTHVDTLTMDYRSGGVELDSIDAINIGLLTLRPAGGFARPHEFNLAQHLFANPAGFTYLMEEKRVPVKFSGLPCLGFQYAFGSFLHQTVNLEFHQYYSPSTHLHLNYHRRSSNGGMRNSAFKLNDLNVQFFHAKNRYSTHVDLFYGGHEYGESAGLKVDTLLDLFSIEFTPVNLSNAQSRVRRVDLNWQNYYRLLGDSILGQGLKFQSRYELTGREFVVPDSLAFNFFDDIFIDSSGTRDQFQTASIKNGGGYYFSSRFLQFDATINHRFWRYQNLGQFRDTNEIFLQSNLWVKLATIELRNEFYFNTLGALGEFYNHTRMSGNFFGMQLNAGLRFDNRLPIPHQRFYVANHVQWTLDDLNLQQLLNIYGAAEIGKKNKLKARVDWTTVTNGLFFIENEWNQDALNVVSVGQLRVLGELHANKWHFYPSLAIGFNTANFAYQPNFTTRNRIVYKTKMFRTQALELALGGDVGYDVAYNHLTYNPLTNTMDPLISPFVTPAMFRLNLFAAIQVEQFRFFLRGENIDYFWNPATNRIDPNYPIMPFLVRLGFSWDFFN